MFINNRKQNSCGRQYAISANRKPKKEINDLGLKQTTHCVPFVNTVWLTSATKQALHHPAVEYNITKEGKFIDHTLKATIFKPCQLTGTDESLSELESFKIRSNPFFYNGFQYQRLVSKLELWIYENNECEKFGIQGPNDALLEAKM